MPHIDPDETLESFFESEMFADCFESLKINSIWKFSLESTVANSTDELFQKQLVVYSEKQIATHSKVLERLLFNLDYFLNKKADYSAFLFSIAISDLEAYLDVKMGEFNSDGYRHHDSFFSGTAFSLDALEANADEFKWIKKYSRDYSNNKVPNIYYRGKEVPSSYLMHCWHLQTIGQMLYMILAELKKLPRFAALKFYYQLEKTSERILVTDWKPK